MSIYVLVFIINVKQHCINSNMKHFLHYETKSDSKIYVFTCQNIYKMKLEYNSIQYKDVNDNSQSWFRYILKTLGRGFQSDRLPCSFPGSSVSCLFPIDMARRVSSPTPRGTNGWKMRAKCPFKDKSQVKVHWLNRYFLIYSSL